MGIVSRSAEVDAITAGVDYTNPSFTADCYQGCRRGLKQYDKILRDTTQQLTGFICFHTLFLMKRKKPYILLYLSSQASSKI